MLIILPKNIRTAYKKLREAKGILKKKYPGFSFTLDGKLIGDIG
jgi:hypothetical protein